MNSDEKNEDSFFYERMRATEAFRAGYLAFRYNTNGEDTATINNPYDKRDTRESNLYRAWEDGYELSKEMEI